MQPVSPPPSPQRKTFGALYFVYLLLVGGYLIYSTFTQTGLGGWLMAKQIELFGSASEKLTIMLPLLVALFLPIPFLPASLKKGSQDQLLPGGAPAAPKAVSWKSLLIMAAVPPLLSLPVYYYLQHEAESDQSRPVVALDLISQPGAPVPPGTKFVRMQAVFQSDYQYVLEQTRYGKVEKTDRYVPLTGPDWKPGQPVRFFLDTSTSAYYDEANGRTLVFDNTTPFPATFSGELHQRALPTVVRQNFEQHGLRAAEPTYLLELLYMPGGQVPGADSQQYWLIPVLGLVLGGALLLGGGLGKIIRQRRGLA